MYCFIGLRSSYNKNKPTQTPHVIHSSTLAWKIPWTEEPGGLQSMGLQRVRNSWATSLSFPFLHLLNMLPKPGFGTLSTLGTPANQGPHPTDGTCCVFPRWQGTCTATWGYFSNELWTQAGKWSMHFSQEQWSFHALFSSKHSASK